ncbi:MAG: enoyl-CoA hydratase/isomerase family protein [Planctomycetaceae bacterium]|nr:enoyl-CoA hydratase/isomerase family protein [Planctomycetaceae bacterium]MBN8599987.1 enoyl-CoA hydratase/isomerase family protein [Planctomycetota bacterium]
MLQVKSHNSVATVVIDRANRCNALSRELVEQLTETLGDLHQEKKIKAVVLAAAGSTFCSGVDLQEWHETLDSQDAMQQWHQDMEGLKDLYEAMLIYPKPLIAAVDGAALGAGLGLVLACDLVVGSHRLTLGLPAPRRGLVSGLVAPLLFFRAGAATASRLLLGDDWLDSQEAHRLGLVHHLVEPNQVWVRAQQWGEKIQNSAPQSLMLTKRMLNEVIGENVLSWLTSGAAMTATACTTEAAAEGLRAFIDKRGPKF